MLGCQKSPTKAQESNWCIWVDPRGHSSSRNKTRNSTPWAQFGEHQCLLQIASGMAKDEPSNWKIEHTTFTQDDAPSDLYVGEHKPHEY